MTKNKKGSSNPPLLVTKPVIEGKEKDSSSKNRKGSSNPPLSVTKDVFEGKEKNSSSGAKKKIGNEIDEIFAGKKKKSVANKKSDKPKAVTPAAVVPDKTVKKQMKRKVDGDIGRGSNSSEEQVSRSKKRKTGDGLVIYTEEELGVGKEDAGGTRLCPFDCDCCF